MFKNLNCFTHYVSNKTLRIVLIVPFVIQIVGTVGLVGFLSFKNGQQAVAELAEQLLEQVGEQVEHNLLHYLAIPQKINQSQALAIRTGVLNWQDFSALERYFAQQLQIYPTVSGIAIATEKKEFLAVERLLKTDSLVIRIKNQSTNNTFQSYDADRKGRRQKLTKTRKDFDPHNDPPNGNPWYQSAKQTNLAIWLPVVSLSQGVDHPTLMVVNFLSFYNQDGTFQGVLGSSLFLPQFVSFLENLKIGYTGQTFIIDRQGLLIASSTGETPFKQNLDTNYRRNLNPHEWRLAANNSQNALTKSSMKFLLNRFGNLNQIQQKEKLIFEFNRSHQFLRVTPISKESGLDWLIVTVVPKSDFMAQIYTNTRTTILLCIAALISATGIGIITARWITKPILRLNKAAKALANREWNQIVVNERSDELGQLAQSFNSMATQLQASFSALKESENLLTHFLEALPVGVAVHDATGKLTYLNQIAKQLINADVSPETSLEEITAFYQVYRAGTNQLYPTEELPALRALKGETLKIDDLEIHQNDQIILLEVFSTPIIDQAGKIIYSINVFTNITERQEAQDNLNNYNEVLEHQVIKGSTELIKTNEQLRQEIIERKQVEQALKESEERFSEIARTIDQFFFIRSASCGQFIYVSPAYEKLWGLSCESLYQNPLSWMDVLHPDDRQMVLDSLNQQFQGNSIKREYRIIHRDGSIRWINAEVSIIRDHTGQLLRFVGFVQDITERKCTEEALRESETRWQLAIDAINAGIWDRNYKTGQVFHSARSQEILGYNHQDIDNSTDEGWMNRLHPDDLSFVMAARQAHLDKQTPYYIAEYRLRGKNGSYKWILSRGQALWDEQGNLIRFVGSHEDISARKLAQASLQQSIQREQEKAEALAQALQELKHTQAQLVQAEKMSGLGQMIAGIAHEINNPITFILGNLTPAKYYFQDLIELLEMYQQTYPNPTPEIAAFVEEIDLEFLTQDWSKLISSMQVGSERISDIVSSLRNFSRLDEKELKPVNLHEGIDNTLLILQHRIKPENKPEIRVIKQYSQLPPVLCHAKQLNQVFINLLNNAIDALENQPAPRLITIETSLVSAQEQTSVMIRISDNGVGMDEEVFNKIFDPFFTTKPVGSGTGLGLSICYQIVVDKHNGKISCTSTLGVGTQFVVEIPLKAAD